MDAFRYIEVHKDEESPFKALAEIIYKLNESQPEIVEGMHELCKSGVLETKEVQAKTRELFNSHFWKETV